ncbi:peptidase M1-like protein [Pontibacter ummariensis]|uniref:Peptidase family M1 n=1 Tax=Pontibacter ummariensis TaxID=1610492 RepID=A0A239I7C5_9BACT|nr:M1 family metallopeptidase [Pontibacter ummariensis]PRY10010.1 peptidase M1-like protein [Pontibacter ummariensis]SNS89381.1 Peptidase family M1 [Pontibacter ummariensis]
MKRRLIQTNLKRLFFAAGLCIGATQAYAQEPQFTRQDTLRGSITPERAWWDLTYYHLNIAVNPADSTIRGMNTIQYKVLEPQQRMQIDLQPPMRLEKVLQNGKELKVQQDGNAWFVQLAEPQEAGAVKHVEVYYSGKPPVSENPPWSGGLTWQYDANGNPFVATSCQGDGASMWWPNKDHMYDEPDSMLISVKTPKGLMDVSNGRLRKVEKHADGSNTYHWFVNNPINNYGVNVNLGDYVHFSDKYKGEKGELDLDYYVLRDNLGKAKKQFAQVSQMLQAFEHWFGPYPFYEDGYKLVEVPYLGMEHQSSVTYGNGYQNGYRGTDLSGSGWGNKFDYIIIHESGHEWFANNITYKDAADMWIHESFTDYSESLFLDYHYGTEAANDYVIGLRKNIRNDRPIIGVYDVNYPGSGDMYFKGANMLHTLRQVVNDDARWRGILRGLNKEFYHQTVTTAQIEDYLSQHVGRDLQFFFDQYLRDVRIPKLEYRLVDNKLQYRWANTVAGFDLPVKVYLNDKAQWLEPGTNWQELKNVKKNTKLTVDRNFYVTSGKVTSA